MLSSQKEQKTKLTKCFNKRKEARVGRVSVENFLSANVHNKLFLLRESDCNFDVALE